MAEKIRKRSKIYYGPFNSLLERNTEAESAARTLDRLNGLYDELVAGGWKHLRMIACSGGFGFEGMRPETQREYNARCHRLDRKKEAE